MTINYGVLKGTVTGHLRDADDDHYQILVQAAAGAGTTGTTATTSFRIASNVKSAAPHAPSTVLFESLDTFPAAFTEALLALPPGFTKLDSKPGGIAIDYVRGGLVDTAAMKPVPPDRPGASNDLKDLLEAAVVAAMAQAGSTVYAFGSRWGPEANRPDQYFHFVPGNGVHDIHMNQGNSGSYAADNGAYQDGALVIAYPAGVWRGFFFAFQSQTFDTAANGQPK
jgi:uncharacterized protein YukJ